MNYKVIKIVMIEFQEYIAFTPIHPFISNHFSHPMSHSSPMPVFLPSYCLPLCLPDTFLLPHCSVFPSFNLLYTHLFTPSPVKSFLLKISWFALVSVDRYLIFTYKVSLYSRYKRNNSESVLSCLTDFIQHDTLLFHLCCSKLCGTH